MSPHKPEKHHYTDQIDIYTTILAREIHIPGRCIPLYRLERYTSLHVLGTWTSIDFMVLWILVWLVQLLVD